MNRQIIFICMVVIVVGIQRAHAQKMTVKDADDNILMEVNDEGTVGSITLPSGSAPTVTTYKLYNVGGVLYWNGAPLPGVAGWTDDGTNVRLTTASDNVGIGTPTPSEKLEVRDGSIVVRHTSSWAPIKFYSNVNKLWEIYGDQAPDDQFVIGGTGPAGQGGWHYLNINRDGTIRFGGQTTFNAIIEGNTGETGIGTLTPSQKLEVDGGIKTTATIIGENGSAGYMDYHTGGGMRFFSQGPDASTRGYVGFFIRESDQGNELPSLYMHQNGNVGIGTVTPEHKLHVKGEVGIQSGLRFDNDLDDSALENGDWVVGGRTAGQNGDFAIWRHNEDTNGLLYMQYGGNVGIGTTNPIRKLQIDYKNQHGYLRLDRDDTSTETLLTFATGGTEKWYMGTRAAAPNTGLHFYSSDAASDVMVIENDGDVGIGTPTPNEQLEITKNFRLPVTTATTGIIKSGGNRFIHNYGANNFFAGVDAGNLTMTGGGNTAVGYAVLTKNTSGVTNTALGSDAMDDNTSGSTNTAVGSSALSGNINGDSNTALGAAALQINTSGRFNVAVGTYALASNLAGENNVAVGDGALGGNLGSNNIAIGKNAGSILTSGSYNICIDNEGVAAESQVIRIGTDGTHIKTYIAGIRGATTGIADAVGVLIDSNGQLGTASSARRYKRDIRSIGDTSQGLMQLRPVSFNYKSDDSRTTQYGLIAEEVAAVFPELVVYDNDGQAETVRYHLLNSMLLNEVQRLNKKIEELEARINEGE